MSQASPSRRCARCDYDLAAWIDPASPFRCSECGAVWTVNSLEAAHARPRLRFLGPIVLVLYLLLLAFPVWFPVVVHLGFPYFNTSQRWLFDTQLTIAFLLFAVVFFPYIVTNARRRLGEFSYIIAAFISLMISAVITASIALIMNLMLML